MVLWSKSEERLKMENINVDNVVLTESEQKTVASLIRLGDSKELAIETVIKQRSKQDATEFYHNAYHI